MFYRYVLFALTNLFLCNSFSYAEQARIDNPSECSAKIGNGGNYYSKHTGKLAGKCEGDALAPALMDNSIVFSVPKKATNSRLGSHTKDRTELAFLRNRIQYNKDYVFDFKVQVDPKSDITNDFYYVMQVWQSPEYSPIFGLRIDRGTKARGAFVIRNQQDSIAGKRIARVNLSSKIQHYQVHMNIGDDLNGRIKIYENSRIISDWSGKIGYPVEKSSNKSKTLTLKFGLYKGSEPMKNFKVSFKDVTLKQMD